MVRAAGFRAPNTERTAGNRSERTCEANLHGTTPRRWLVRRVPGKGALACQTRVTKRGLRARLMRRVSQGRTLGGLEIQESAARRSGGRLRGGRPRQILHGWQ